MSQNYAIAESPGTGRYVCQKCGKFTVDVTGPRDQLPPCQTCGHDASVKYAKKEAAGK